MMKDTFCFDNVPHLITMKYINLCILKIYFLANIMSLTLTAQLHVKSICSMSC